MFEIEPADHLTDEIHQAVVRLLPHLSKSSPAPTAEQVGEIANSPATVLFLARDGAGGPIVGTLTLAMFRIPSGLRAWIEDVIVDPAVEGRGCGRQLTQAALDAARAAGARTVELTSRPSREAANHLYQRLGFQIRDTNVYRYDLA
ncbi:MAG TPA: GNAT family N-acetyltransferase [Acidimicrobiales bacterium]|jgi:ribosomal protein S18 acetylase RimI-like enzyme|nr:GNAT family N-acetyltransferase [Acidimicrobiales bacterium]